MLTNITGPWSYLGIAVLPSCGLITPYNVENLDNVNSSNRYHLFQCWIDIFVILMYLGGNAPVTSNKIPLIILLSK